MTLKFLGEVAEPKIEEIKISLSKLEYAGFKASLTEIGVFPNQNYVRVVWAGVEQEDFIRLQAQIDSQLAKLGFKKDKRFHPHLTLARVNFVEDKASFGKLLSEIKMKNLEFKVDEFKLIKSTLTREGPIYEDLAVFKLSS